MKFYLTCALSLTCLLFPSLVFADLLPMPDWNICVEKCVDCENRTLLYSHNYPCRGCDAYGIEKLCKERQMREQSRQPAEILPDPERDTTQTAEHKDDAQAGGDALPTAQRSDAQDQTTPATIDPKQKHHACAMTHVLSSDTPSLFAILLCMLALLSGCITLRKKGSSSNAPIA